ncbi:hypothetical protein FNV43_RR10245 [Rhamnella rubrinervis]|uniref:Uncharacterized protein n=1 Tax=Rhamnella rubrinervis TaxID=2594499 RepID=A0A8K0HBW1_9ROSA|nr:hypothetical protein FNV43_RR10245 [Rhamnella rubrinervis]
MLSPASVELSSGEEELGESKLMQETSSGCGGSIDGGVESAGEEEYEIGFVRWLWLCEFHWGEDLGCLE